jgi:hypothetical protein
MTHEACRSKLLELAYGELSRDEARAAEAHVADCAECRAELEKVQGTRRAMARLPLEPAPAEGEAVLFAAAREPPESRRATRRGRILPSWAWGGAVGLAAAAAVVAVSYRLVELEPRRADDLDALRGGGYEAPETSMKSAPSAPDAAPNPNPNPNPSAQRSAPTLGAAPPASPPPAPSRKSVHAAPPPRVAAAPERERESGREVAEPDDARAESRAVLRSAPPPRAAAAPEPERESGREAVAEPDDARAESRAARAQDAAPAEAPADADERQAEARADRAKSAPVARQPFPAAAPPTFPPPGVERRTFKSCPGEHVRELERDADGRVIRWAREGELGGRAVRVEARYGEDGALLDLNVTPAGADVDAADAAALGVPLRAADASLDGPPRCDGTR